MGMEYNNGINCVESAALMKNMDMETTGLGQEPEGLHNENDNVATTVLDPNETVEMEHMMYDEEVSSVSCRS